MVLQSTQYDGPCNGFEYIQLSITKDHSARNTRVTGMYTKELGLIDHAIL